MYDRLVGSFVVLTAILWSGTLQAGSIQVLAPTKSVIETIGTTKKPAVEMLAKKEVIAKVKKAKKADKSASMKMVGKPVVKKPTMAEAAVEKTAEVAVEKVAEVVVKKELVFSTPALRTGAVELPVVQTNGLEFNNANGN